MRLELTPDLRGQRMAVHVEHARGYLDTFPGVRVVRKQDSAARAAGAGLLLFDAHRQFGDPAAPARFCRRQRGLTANAAAEAGLVEFELWEAHPTAPLPDALHTTPSHVHFDIWTGSTYKTARLAVTDAHRSTQQFLGSTIDTTQYFDGVQLVLRVDFWVTPGEPRRLSLIAGNDPMVTVFYDVHEDWRANLSLETGPQGQYDGAFTWTRDGAEVLSGAIRHVRHADLGSWWLGLDLVDAVPSRPLAPAGLTPQTYYYYSLNLAEGPGQAGPVFSAEPAAAAEAMATGLFGEGDRLYRGLAAIHRNYDEPDPEVTGQGQLRRFLSIFGAPLDQARGYAVGLGHRHDVFSAAMSSLPLLARWIGWDIDRTTSAEVQRNDVLFATRLFERVGTVQGLAVLIPRVTDLPFQLREFADNVFYTNQRPTHYWDIWKGSSADGEVIGQCSGAATPNLHRLAGRPAAIAGGNGGPWLFWHQVTDGRRELWVRWPLTGLPWQRVATGDGAQGPATSDECPAVVDEATHLRLFWSSDRDGQWNIWTRTTPRDYLGGPLSVGAAERLTTSKTAEERNPAAVIEPGGRLWLFWQSNRRGPVDIWARTRTAGAWDEPRRITTAVVADQMPAAALDAEGHVRLFWSATTPSGCRLFESVLGATLAGDDAWSAPAQVPSPAVDDDALAYRDEAPCVVLHQGRLHLLWHSNRNGSWQLWSCIRENGAWGPAFQPEHQLTDGTITRMITAKEPTATVYNGAIYTYWRSQRRGEQFASRTFDTANPAAKAALGTLGDWNHYTYDTRRDLQHWYASDTVGIHFSVAVDDDPQATQMTLERVKAFIDPYRPATVRIVLFAGMEPLA